MGKKSDLYYKFYTWPDVNFGIFVLKADKISVFPPLLAGMP